MEPLSGDAVLADLQSVGRSMSAIATILRRGQRKTLDPTRFGVLQLATEPNGIRPSELAKELQVSASSITRQAQALQKDGKVDIAEDPTDRRGYLITITEAGRAELREIERGGVAFLAGELAEWDPDMVHILSVLMARLVDTMAAGHVRRQQERGNSSPLTA